MIEIDGAVDDGGNRVAKTVNGVTTYYLVDDLNPTGHPQVIEELSSAGTVERQYTYGLQGISESQVLNGTWTPSFYGYGGGGNVRNLTNSAGAVTDQYEYDAFGNAWTVSGSTPNNFLYRGEQYDPDLNLYYLRSRYMNPLTGRFMSRDPEDGDFDDPTTLHKYLYAGNDPVDLSDPSGQSYALPAPNPRPLSGFEYALLIGTISIPVAQKSLPPIACELNAWFADFRLWILRYNDVVADFPGCTATGTPPQAPPIAPPIALPLTVPQSSPEPPQKDPRYKDLNSIVDGIKKTIRSSGGSCSSSLSPAENYARLALWNAYLNARLNERAECSQYDPNPEGHQKQIDDIWTNIIKCEVILHEF